MSTLHRITVYPIKSLDGHHLSRSLVLPNGALAEDRRYALVDSWGKYTNGKNCEAIHQIRASFDEGLQNVTLSCQSQQDTFALPTQQAAIADWCGKVLGKKCRLIENSEGGFPDDCESPGPTIVSTATLEAVAGWFPNMDLEEARRRFRFNLEAADGAAFWEDCLVRQEHQVSRFRIGLFTWQAHGLCQRCVVPTRDSLDGTVTPAFARRFVQNREAELPPGVVRERFDHFYRLGVNLRLDTVGIGNALSVGDPIEKIG